LEKVVDFFKGHEPFAGMGIGTFGPCDVNPGSPTYGRILNTPKMGWANVNILGIFRQTLAVPIGFDTDVNVAALGESKWGAGQGLGMVLYLTVGTGVGGGGVMNGQMMHGMIHPEMGHIRLPWIADTDKFAGICPYHGNCLEGLASGPALEARWGMPAAEIPSDHPAWEIEARYLALAVCNYICILSPHRIIMGGGVMRQNGLFPLIRAEVKRLLNGYIQSPMILERIDEYIVPPGLADRAGVLGAIALAQHAAEKEDSK
jgi:fructokinase